MPSQFHDAVDTERVPASIRTDHEPLDDRISRPGQTEREIHDEVAHETLTGHSNFPLNEDGSTDLGVRKDPVSEAGPFFQSTEAYARNQYLVPSVNFSRTTECLFPEDVPSAVPPKDSDVPKSTYQTEGTSVAKTIFMESPETTETYGAGFAGTLNSVNEIEAEFQARSEATISNGFAPPDKDVCLDQLPVQFASIPPTRTDATPFASSAIPERAATGQTTEAPSS